MPKTIWEERKLLTRTCQMALIVTQQIPPTSRVTEIPSALGFGKVLSCGPWATSPSHAEPQLSGLGYTVNPN